MSGDGTARTGWLAALLNGAVVIERSTLTRPLRDYAMTDLSRCAKLSLGTLNAVLDRSLPVCGSLLLYKSLCRGRRRSRGSFNLYSCARAD